MAQFFTDFTEYTLGVQPSDWTARWVTANATYSVVNTGMPAGSVGGQTLHCGKALTNRALLTWDQVGSVANVEIVMRFAGDRFRTEEAIVGAVTRGSGSGGAETSYSARLLDTLNDAGISLYNSGASTTLGDADVHTLGNNTWYWIRGRSNGSTIQMRTWADGAAEPGTWTVSVTNSTIAAAGWAGILFFSGRPTPVDYWVDVFGVGTNGDVAPSAPLIEAIEGNHIASTLVLHAPGVAVGGVVLAANHIATTVAAHQPAATPGLVSVAANHIASASAIQTPAVTSTGAVGMQHIDAAATLHVPSLRYSQTLSALHIGSTEAAHTPGVTYSQTIEGLSVSSGLVLHEPATTIGAVALGGQHIASTLALYAPGVTVGGVAIGGQHIDSTVVLYVLAVDIGPIRSYLPLASVRLAQPRFYVSLYPPVGSPSSRNRLDVIDINPSVTGLNWQSSVPGGWSQLTAGLDHNDTRYDQPLADPLIPRNLMLADFAHVELTDGGLTLYEGRIEDRDEPPGGARSLIVRGYGYTAVRDMPYLGASTTLATSGQVLRTILASAASTIRPASGELFIDPQVSHAPAEFVRLFPSQVLDQIAKEGDSDGHLMDWAVWAGRLLTLKPRVPPATPDYWVPLDKRYVSNWKRHVADRVGIVWVEHTVDGVLTVTGPLDDPRFVDEVGFQRGVVLKAGEISVSGATRLARTFLGYRSRPRYTGEISIGPDDTLIGAGGQPVPSYLARAGQWVQVGDHEPLVAVTQEYNANAGRLKLQIGDRVASYQTAVAGIMRDVELQKAGTNPVGGRNR